MGEEPIYKDYDNAEIAASGLWYITPVDDNILPIARYAPYNVIQVQNSSDSNIKVYPNGSNNQAFTVYAGCSVTLDKTYEWVLVKNLDTVNAISANELNVQIGKGLEIEVEK